MLLLPDRFTGKHVYKPPKHGSLCIKIDSLLVLMECMKTASKYENAQHKYKKSFQMLREEIGRIIFFHANDLKTVILWIRIKLISVLKFQTVYNSG